MPVPAKFLRHSLHLHVIVSGQLCQALDTFYLTCILCSVDFILISLLCNDYHWKTEKLENSIACLHYKMVPYRTMEMKLLSNLRLACSALVCRVGFIAGHWSGTQEPWQFRSSMAYIAVWADV